MTPADIDTDVHEAAKRILQFYTARSAHIGEAADRMAVDYAHTIVELQQLEERVREAVSRGLIRSAIV